MKTISMDFETYKAELEAAKLEGASMTERLLGDVNSIFSGLISHDNKEFERALYDLNYFILNLKKSSKP